MISGSGTASGRGAGSLVLRRLVCVGVLAGGAVTAAAFLGHLFWLAELFTHFRLQLAGGILMLTILALVLRMPISVIVGVALLVVNLSYLMPYLLPGVRAAPASPMTVRILSSNLGMGNKRYAAVRDLIDDTQPDLIGFSEVSEDWLVSLASLRDEYPHRISHPQDGAFGLALLSRFPIRELSASPYFEEGLQTAIVAQLDTETISTTLVLAHVRAPTTPSYASLRNLQLERLASIVQERGGEVILLGDLNITPWSPFYAVLERDTGLSNAALGQGYQATWPTRPSVLRIPIDHFLVSEGITVVDLSRGDDIGSDHLPLLVDVVFNTAKPEARP